MTNFKAIQLSDSAKIDLQNIAEYTFNHWGGIQKKSYLDLIKKSFNTLTVSGNIGVKRNDISNGLFSYIIKKYVVYFRETKN